VSVLDAFLSTWECARKTFGEGTPLGGDAFDGSAHLRTLQRDVEAAAQTPDWTGPAAERYTDANQRQGRTLGALADLDQQLRAEIERSAEVVTAGRRDLDAVRERVLAVASTLPNDAEGQRMLLPLIRNGSVEITEIVQRSHDDMSAVAERIRRIDGQYQTVGQ
jgi:uncharacterized protein YukE